MSTELLQAYAIPVALHVLLAAAVWLVGRWRVKRSRGWLPRSLQNTNSGRFRLVASRARGTGET